MVNNLQYKHQKLTVMKMFHYGLKMHDYFENDYKFLVPDIQTEIFYKFFFFNVSSENKNVEYYSPIFSFALNFLFQLNIFFLLLLKLIFYLYSFNKFQFIAITVFKKKYHDFVLVKKLNFHFPIISLEMTCLLSI